MSKFGSCPVLISRMTLRSGLMKTRTAMLHIPRDIWASVVAIDEQKHAEVLNATKIRVNRRLWRRQSIIIDFRGAGAGFPTYRSGPWSGVS